MGIENRETGKAEAVECAAGEDKGRKGEKAIAEASERTVKKTTVLLFVLLFLYGCFAFNDYGISVDENVERNTCLVTYKYLVPSVADIVTESVNFPEIEALDTYTDRYYGVAVQLPTVVVEHLFGFRLPLRTVYLIRHFYTFLLFYGAAVVFYFLGKRITGSQWGALFGTVMLVLSPRMLAESFYNIKDIVFLSFVIYNLYAGICFLDRPTVKNGIVLAAVSALCINVRVVGAVALAACLCAGFLKGLAGLLGSMEPKESSERKESAVSEEGLERKESAVSEEGPERKGSSGSNGMRFVSHCLLLLMVLVVSISIYILSLPVLWKNPAAELVNTVKTFSNFTNWDDIFRYRGFAVRGNNLPRSYLFVWIFISTPVLYLVLFGLGMAERFAAWIGELAAVVRGRKKAEECQELWRHVFFGMVLVIPLCYVVLRKPTLYNGWRHFYFLYAVIMIYALNGALFLWKLAAGWDEKRRQYADGNAAQNARQKGVRPGMWNRHRGKIVGSAFLSLSMAVTFVWMVKNHPYEYMYFNPFVRSYALQNFELDYWAVSEADMFRYICDHDDREEIRVWCTFSDYYKSLMMMPETDRIRLVYADTPMEADYAVCRDLMKTSAEQMERQFAFEEVHSAVVDGRVINSVFRRTDEAVMKSMVAWNGEELFCSGNDVAWRLVREPDGKELMSETVREPDGKKLMSETARGPDGKELMSETARGPDGKESIPDAVLESEDAALTADFGREMNLTKISLRHENQAYLEGLRCYTSADGESWTELTLVKDNENYILYNKRTVFRCSGPIRFLKLTHQEELIPEDLAGLALEAELYADRDSRTEQVLLQTVERVTGHENSVASEQAVDGSMMTRWQSEDVQRQGIAFDIVLNDVYSLSGIHLDTGDAPNEYPRALRIFATEDDAEWEELSVESADQILFSFPDTQAKTIRLITGNMDGMDVTERWSIYEITLMQRTGQ